MVQMYFNETESTCREKCVQNCSCSGYSFTSGMFATTNCTLHSPSAVIYNARTSNESVTSPFMLRFEATPTPASTAGHSSFSGTKLIVTVVLLATVGVALVALALLWWLVRMRKVLNTLTSIKARLRTYACQCLMFAMAACRGEVRARRTSGMWAW